MTSGETLITLLLGVIAYLLYQIAKQLSYLTGKRIKISFFNWRKTYRFPKKSLRRENPSEPRLPN